MDQCKGMELLSLQNTEVLTICTKLKLYYLQVQGECAMQSMSGLNANQHIFAMQQPYAVCKKRKMEDSGMDTDSKENRCKYSYLCYLYD